MPLKAGNFSLQPSSTDNSGRAWPVGCLLDFWTSHSAQSRFFLSLQMAHGPGRRCWQVWNLWKAHRESLNNKFAAVLLVCFGHLKIQKSSFQQFPETLTTSLQCYNPPKNALPIFFLPKKHFLGDCSELARGYFFEKTLFLGNVVK